eukprot:scaffold44426_cov56-Phaeocystis_antarctica.AAC.3
MSRGVNTRAPALPRSANKSRFSCLSPCLVFPQEDGLDYDGSGGAHAVGTADDLPLEGCVEDRVEDEEVGDEGEVEADAAVLAEHEEEAIELLLLPWHALQDAVGPLLRVGNAALHPAGRTAVVEAGRPLVAWPAAPAAAAGPPLEHGGQAGVARPTEWRWLSSGARPDRCRQRTARHGRHRHPHAARLPAHGGPVAVALIVLRRPLPPAARNERVAHEDPLLLDRPRGGTHLGARFGAARVRVWCLVRQQRHLDQLPLAEVAAHLHLVMEGAARARAVGGAAVAEARQLSGPEVAPMLRHRLVAQPVHQPRGHLLEVILELGENHRLGRWRGVGAQHAVRGAAARGVGALLTVGEARCLHDLDDVLGRVVADAPRVGHLVLVQLPRQPRLPQRQPDRFGQLQVSLGVAHHERLQQRGQPLAHRGRVARECRGDLAPPQRLASSSLAGGGLDAIAWLAEEGEQPVQLHQGTLGAGCSLAVDGGCARHDPPPLGGERGDEEVGRLHLMLAQLVPLVHHQPQPAQPHQRRRVRVRRPFVLVERAAVLARAPLVGGQDDGVRGERVLVSHVVHVGRTLEAELVHTRHVALGIAFGFGFRLEFELGLEFGLGLGLGLGFGAGRLTHAVDPHGGVRLPAALEAAQVDVPPQLLEPMLEQRLGHHDERGGRGEQAALEEGAPAEQALEEGTLPRVEPRPDAVEPHAHRLEQAFGPRRLAVLDVVVGDGRVEADLEVGLAALERRVLGVRRRPLVLEAQQRAEGRVGGDGCPLAAHVVEQRQQRAPRLGVEAQRLPAGRRAPELGGHRGPAARAVDDEREHRDGLTQPRVVGQDAAAQLPKGPVRRRLGGDHVPERAALVGHEAAAVLLAERGAEEAEEADRRLECIGWRELGLEFGVGLGSGAEEVVERRSGDDVLCNALLVVRTEEELLQAQAGLRVRSPPPLCALLGLRARLLLDHTEVGSIIRRAQGLKNAVD